MELKLCYGSGIVLSTGSNKAGVFVFTGKERKIHLPKSNFLRLKTLSTDEGQSRKEREH